MSEQLETGQQEAAVEQGASANLQGAQADQQVPLTEGAAGDQEIAPLKDLQANALDDTAASLSNGGNLSGSNTGGMSTALNMDSLMDVPVTLSVEIGRKRMPINQLVNLAPGAIVDLNRDLDAPIDLLVNGTLIARGEVVVMGKKFGLRLVDICSPNERVRGLAH